MNTEKIKLYDGPVIDAHHHFWDPIKNDHPWLKPDVLIPFRYGDYTSIKKKYYPEDYFMDVGNINVVGTCYMETEWDPTDPCGESEFITSVAKKTGYPNAVVGQAWLHHDDTESVLKMQSAYELMRSIRHKPEGPDKPEDVGQYTTLMSNEKWRYGYSLLAKYNLMFDLQTPWWNLHEAVKLANDFPDTMIILNHTGLPAQRSVEGLAGWHSAMAALAECENVVVKVSGIGLKGIPWSVENNLWIISEVLSMFGPDRIMFASNFPVDSLCGSFSDIFHGFMTVCEMKGYSHAAQRKMFHDNCKRIYRTIPPHEIKENNS
ncbi:amidohydrolase family protein [Salmonella enterica]|nr:amidohydrolase family protein [Salmonella enterica]ELG9050519.1 amidohydrolase family protein [Salmonella enterica]